MRRLLGASFVDFLGSGLFLAFSAVYFTGVVGLAAGQVGLGMSIAGAAAIAAAIPLGRAADRYGVRRALVLVHALRAAGTAAYAFVGDWWGYLVVVTIITVADQIATALTQAYVAEIVEGDSRVKVLASYRTVINLAISVGGPLGGLLAGTGLFRTIILANAAAYLLVTAAFATLPQPVRTEEPAPVRRGLGVLRDLRLLSLAGVDGVLQLWQPILNLAFPLWLAQATTLPDGLLGVLYAINTVLALAFQALIARHITSLRAARRCQPVAAAFAAAACLLFWYAAQSIPLALFCAALVMLTAAELIAVPASWTLSYAFAPDDQRGEYLAAFGMGRSVSRYVLGPVLITGMLQLVGGWTWGVLALLFVAAGIIAPLAIRYADAMRPAAS
ncbi:MFS transporter [Nonomuraea sp. NPDC001699]